MRLISARELPLRLRVLVLEQVGGGVLGVQVSYDPGRHELRWWRLDGRGPIEEPVESGKIPIPFELLEEAERLSRPRSGEFAEDPEHSGK
jgi:hypothetical protein